jgi:aminopeptidase N
MLKSYHILVFFFLHSLSYAQYDILDTGGPLIPEQIAYDVHHYDLKLEILPDEKFISGTLRMTAEIKQATGRIAMDLDTLLTIHSMTEIKKGKHQKISYIRESGRIWVNLGTERQVDETLVLAINYYGKPRVAKRPPWDGGFTWARTSSGGHWIATTCQGEGADLWWPNKDHVSDKPDSMDLHITVPENLVVATNGKLVSEERPDNNRDKKRIKIYHWKVTTPISSYNIALNIAPYEVLHDEIKSVNGHTFPVVFYVLPEDVENGRKLLPEIIDHVKWFEQLLGPYPFQQDKYGVAQTPHLGMEHQTIIAYGANFNNGSMTAGQDWGFDALHQHELAHEWWGNLLTNADWKDMWLHEGFGMYMQPLYAEHLFGKKVYHRYMATARFFSNRLPIAPRESKYGKQIYQAPIYTKGAWVLHTLRYYLGDEQFFESLKQFAYPGSEKYRDSTFQSLDGRQVRFVSTDDFVETVEKVSGQEMDWFFEVYTRQAKLPVLLSNVRDGKLHLRWQVPNDLPFSMPVEVKLGLEVKRYTIPPEGLVIPFKKGDQPEVDPDRWVLMDVKKG